MILTTNANKNLPITLEDIKAAEMIFGQYIHSLNGKTVSKEPLLVASNYIEIPKESINNHHDVLLCIDIMKINGLTFLTTISRKIMYRTAEFLPNQSVQAYRSVLNTIFRIYYQAGFKISTINYDNEC